MCVHAACEAGVCVCVCVWVGVGGCGCGVIRGWTGCMCIVIVCMKQQQS